MKKNFFNHNLSSLLGLTDSHILTFTGGGGKTSLMNTLGIEFAKQRIPTLLTTTTHIMKPDFLPSKACIEEENLEQITSFFTNLEEDILPLAALGIPEKKIYNKVKWKSPSINFMKKLSLFSRKYSNISLRILCEGDGSKRLPIKLPKDGEPVFFPKTDTVIGVIGLSCLGKPIKEMLFRYELLPKLIFTQKIFLHKIISRNCHKPHTTSLQTFYTGYVFLKMGFGKIFLPKNFVLFLIRRMFSTKKLSRK